MILGIDTANEAISLALWSPQQGLAPVVSALFPVRDMAERLTHEAALLFAAAHTTPQQLGGIVCTVGPGGFSGVRVGLGYASGLAIGLNIPLYGVSVHEALARGLKPRIGATAHNSILVVQNAGRGMVYAQAFSADCVPLGALHETTPEQLQSIIRDLPTPVALTGNGATALGLNDAVISADCRVDAQVLTQMWPHLQANPAQYPPQAVYIRPPDAKLPGGITPPCP
jgi:tRNA threonylcarbamoyladenosine biosynthesis protein TsaB